MIDIHYVGGRVELAGKALNPASNISSLEEVNRESWACLDLILIHIRLYEGY